jgi:large repetitive protein
MRPFYKSLVGTIALAFGLMLTTPVSAQLVPPDQDEFHALRCNPGVSTDDARDTPGGTSHRDVVGTTQFPAVFYTSDDTHFYLKMRLDDDPRQRDELKSFGWGFLLDQDDAPNTYEHLVLLNGIREELQLSENTIQGELDDRTDGAEIVRGQYDPLVDSYHVDQADTPSTTTPTTF